MSEEDDELCPQCGAEEEFFECPKCGQEICVVCEEGGLCTDCFVKENTN